jgi:hypothetical protein
MLSKFNEVSYKSVVINSTNKEYTVEDILLVKNCLI